MLLIFFLQIMISQVNYGTMVDDANAQKVYEEIDSILIATCRELMD